MKLIVAFAAVAALTAGPALAQSAYGARPTPGSAGSTYHPPSIAYSTPSYGSSPTQKIYGAPSAFGGSGAP